MMALGKKIKSLSIAVNENPVKVSVFGLDYDTVMFADDERFIQGRQILFNPDTEHWQMVSVHSTWAADGIRYARLNERVDSACGPNPIMQGCLTAINFTDKE